MPPSSFDNECDRLSHSVDGALFERLRWERNEGPMLAHLVTLARAAFESRPEFELTEEGASRDIKRFVLKIHGNRVVAISLKVEDGKAVIEAHPIDRSSYRVSGGATAAADLSAVDAEWMTGALQELFSRVGL